MQLLLRRFQMNLRSYDIFPREDDLGNHVRGVSGLAPAAPRGHKYTRVVLPPHMRQFVRRSFRPRRRLARSRQKIERLSARDSMYVIDKCSAGQKRAASSQEIYFCTCGVGFRKSRTVGHAPAT